MDIMEELEQIDEIIDMVETSSEKTLLINKSIIAAVENNDFKKVRDYFSREIIEYKYDTNSSEKKPFGIVKSIETQEKEREETLIAAIRTTCRDDNIEMLKYLRELGGELHDSDEVNLLVALSNQSHKVLEYWAENKEPIDVNNKFLQKKFSESKNAPNLKFFQYYIDNGGDVNPLIINLMTISLKTKNQELFDFILRTIDEKNIKSYMIVGMLRQYKSIKKNTPTNTSCEVELGMVMDLLTYSKHWKEDNHKVLKEAATNMELISAVSPYYDDNKELFFYIIIDENEDLESHTENSIAIIEWAKECRKVWRLSSHLEKELNQTEQNLPKRKI